MNLPKLPKLWTRRRLQARVGFSKRLRARLTTLGAGTVPAAALVGLACGVAAWACASTAPVTALETSGMSLQFRLRGPRFADKNVVVLQVGDFDLPYVRERYGRGWPLPRRFYADIVEHLRVDRARTVALDILFTEPSDSPNDDSSLERACRRAGNVVQACAFKFPQDARYDLPSSAVPERLAPRFAVAGSSERPRRADWVAAPLVGLASAAAALGHVDVFPETNGSLRRVAHLIRYHDSLYPSLSLAAVAQFKGLGPSELRATPVGVALGPEQVPLDENGDLFVNWIGANSAFPAFSATDLLTDKVPPGALQGRLVVVGVTAQGAFENRATPLSGAQPALQFQANAVDDLLSQRMLRLAPAGLSLALLLVLPTVCAWMTDRWALRGVGGSAGLLLLLWAASVTAFAHDIFLPVALPGVAALVAMIASMLAGFRVARDGNVRNDAAVAAFARGASLLGATMGAGGRERLHAIIRATARETIGAREVYLVLPEVEAVAGPQARPLSPVEVAARMAAERGHTLLWPAAPLRDLDAVSPLRRLRRLRGVGADGTSAAAAQNRLFELAASWTANEAMGDRGRAAGENTLIVAPLPLSGALDETGQRLGERKFAGALVAAGRRRGGHFNPSEAALLEALAEQAALALANWEFYLRLQGRVELANRDLRETYRQLSEQSAKLFAAVESIDAALVVTDQDGKAIMVNPAGAHVLRGATPILGEEVSAALSAGDLDELAELFRNLSEPSPPGVAPTGRLQREAVRGNEVLSAQFTPLRGEDNQLLGAMLVVADVSAQRELDRMKTDFVGFVAHELRTPLTTILGYASLLDQTAGRLTVEQTREMTTVISRHCRRMNRLISDLLDIARMEAGTPLPILRSTCDLTELCRRLVFEQRTQLNPEPTLEINLEAPPRAVRIQADPDRLEQVIINLLSNAVKYSPEGGTITLRLQPEPGRVVLTVQDEGLGMTPEQVTHLFQKFYRTPDAQARNIKGTGLGLHLVKQIIDAHGGSIEVKSTAGAGTKFTVFIPGVVVSGEPAG